MDDSTARFPKADQFAMDLEQAKTEAELRALCEKAFRLIFDMENTIAGFNVTNAGLRERLRRLHAGLPEFDG